MNTESLVNEGSFDRAVRIIVGLVVLSLTVTGSPWGLLGLVPLVTGIVGFCPLYRVAGIRTCPAPRVSAGRAG